MLKPLDVAKLVVQALDEKQGRDVSVLKVDELTVLADYFVICTATSTTHIKTLTDAIEKLLEENSEPVRRREGYRSGGWVLLDFGCVIVHLFLEDLREFYHLERLWGDAEEITI